MKTTDVISRQGHPVKRKLLRPAFIRQPESAFVSALDIECAGFQICFGETQLSSNFSPPPSSYLVFLAEL